jgi:Tol biopolymer transport system component
VDGSERRTIFEGQHRSLFGMSWSHEPQRVAFSHGVVFGGPGAGVNIKAASPAGDETVDLTADAGNNGFPSYSPDGTQLVFRSGRDGSKNLYIMDRTGDNVRRLTDGKWTDTMCDWSHQGDWITFASDRDDDFEVWMIRPDGSDLHKVIGGGGRHNHPHFSPDGRWLVFTSQRAGYSAEEVSLPHQPQPYGDLFVIRPDGTGLLRLTHNSFEEGTPAWSSRTDIVPSGAGNLDEADY